MGTFKYYPGDIVGDYNVKLLERLYKKKPRTWYGKFECPYCGKSFIARIDAVKNGKTKSCGCLHSEQAKINGRKASKTTKYNLNGQIFGYLEILEEADDSHKKSYRNGSVWKCLCHKCGKICYVSQDCLHKGTQSCGCLVSKGEEKIASIINNLNLDFTQQYSPADCINPETNRRFRFDFYITKYNLCIEYDGEQHFKDAGGWFNNHSLEQIKKYDKLKNEYCKLHNIALIRIPYYDFNKINDKYLIQLIQNCNCERNYNNV